MRIGKRKADTPEPQPFVIPEVYKTPKTDIRVEITSTHKYNTMSITKIVNHVTTFKSAPKMFKMDAAEKNKDTHRYRILCSHIPQIRNNHSGTNSKPH